MKCPKCQNLMVAERFTDYGQSGELEFIGWRCLSCGLILDPTILQHRTQKKASEEPKPRRRQMANVKA